MTNKKLLKSLIRKEFDSLDLTNITELNKAEQLIDLAKNLGFKNLVSQMIDDFNYEF